MSPDPHAARMEASRVMKPTLVQECCVVTRGEVCAEIRTRLVELSGRFAGTRAEGAMILDDLAELVQAIEDTL